MLRAARSLLIFLSNRCNLSCDYCFVAVNEGEPRRLGLAELKRAIDAFLDCSAPPRLATFLGGEPFLQFPVMLKAIDHMRARAPKDSLSVNVFTNGTLLTAEKLRLLEEREVWTILSLDGDKASNDRHRVFARGAGSVYDEAARRLRGLPKGRMGLNIVLTPDTVPSLVENIDHFYREGFRAINFYPELYQVWSAEQLAALQRAFAGFERYYLALFDERREPFRVAALSSVLERASAPAEPPWWRQCGNIVLGSDGRYHACDKAMSFPAADGERSQVGDADAGLQWERRDAMLAEAADAVERDAGASEFVLCPLGTYFHSRWSAGDWKTELRSFQAVNDLYAKTFLSIAGKLAGRPSFEQMYRPRTCSLTTDTRDG